MPNNSRPPRQDDGLAILHLDNAINQTTPVYNEHCLPLIGERQLAICTYFGAKIATVKEIATFNGDGTVTGFFRALKAALAYRDYDIIHAQSPQVALLFSFRRMTGLRKGTASTVCTIHNCYQSFRPRNKFLLLFSFALFERVVCCGKASFNSFPKLYRWLAGDRLTYVQNGLDLARVDHAPERPQADPKPSDFTIVSACRFVKIKNLPATIAAFKLGHNSTSRLILVGDGPMSEQLTKQIEADGLAEHVTMTGLLPRNQVYEHFQRSDLFVSSSRGEGLPVAVLEAMACRCPVLLSDIAPHREIAEGVDFIPLVPADDAAGFAREIARFRDMPASRRAAIGEQCRKLVEERFSLSRMHAGYESVYRELRGTKGS